MADHLFLETIYTQPTCVIDLIQSYSHWAAKYIDNRTVIIVREVTEETNEYIEEYIIDNIYMLTVKTIIYPKNPSIVLLESLWDGNIETSRINMIINDYDETYLTLSNAIKIIAGRNVISDMPGNNQNDPDNPNDPSDPDYNNTLDVTTYSVNWNQAATGWKSVYIDTDVNLGSWSQIGTTDWKGKVVKTGTTNYSYSVKSDSTGEVLIFHLANSLNNVIAMMKQVASMIPSYGKELEIYYPA